MKNTALIIVMPILTISGMLFSMLDNLIILLRRLKIGDGYIYWIIISCIFLLSVFLLIRIIKLKKPGIIANTVPAYPQHQRILSTIFLVLLCSVFLIWGIRQIIRVYGKPHHVIIAIAEFVNFSEQHKEESLIVDRTIAQSIIEHFQEELHNDTSVKIIPTGFPIVSSEWKTDQQIALEIATNWRFKATVIVWGWYSKSASNVIVHPKIYVVGKKKKRLFVPLDYRVRPLQDVNAFQLQLDLAKEIPYLTYYALGLLRSYEGSYQIAIDYYSKVLHFKPVESTPPGTHIIYFELANNYFYCKKIGEAEIYYNQSIKLKPDFAQAHNNIGNLLSFIERNLDAESHYKTAISLSPESAEPHNNYANLLFKIGRIEEAKIEFEKAIELDPTYAMAHSDLGYLLKSESNLIEAEEHYKIALNLKPDLFLAHNGYANLLWIMKKNTQAEQHWQEALKIRDVFPEAHNNYGAFLMTSGRLKEAKYHFNKALEFDPEFVESQKNLISLFLLANDVVKAKTECEKILVTGREHPDVLFNHAIIMFRLGEKTKATEELTKCVTQADRKGDQRLKKIDEEHLSWLRGEKMGISEDIQSLMGPEIIFGPSGRNYLEIHRGVQNSR